MNYEAINLRDSTKALRHFYPEVALDRDPLPVDIKGLLPVWLKDAVQIYGVTNQQKPNKPILYLIYPRRSFDFEHLIRIYKQLSATLDAPALIIVDRLSPKYRPLLVRFRIPFIYKNESVFAPDLGLKFGKLEKINAPIKAQIEETGNALPPISLKLMAGILTKQISESFTLKSLYEKIQQEKIKISHSKLSIALKQLVSGGFLYAKGVGPKKKYVRDDIKIIWKSLLATPLRPFFREFRINYIRAKQGEFCLAGETGLAQYSNLASPKQMTLAMTATNYRKALGSGVVASSNILDERFTVQIWKEDPWLFSINNAINPVELFFSMHQETDERIQLSLTEMLKSYGLSR
jgi:hypothetical protein